MAVYTPGSVSDLESIDSIKKVQEYLIKQERKLDYMFNNLDPRENYSELARLTMVTDGQRQATIEAALDGIKLNYVSKDGIVSAINLSEETVQIQADKIKLEGVVTVNGNFKVGLDGSIEATNGRFKGDISASNIRGSHIYGSYIGTTDDNFFILADEAEGTTGDVIMGLGDGFGYERKKLMSNTLGSWTNPATDTDTVAAINGGTGAAGFDTLYVRGVSNDIATEIGNLWYAISHIDPGGDDDDDPTTGGGDDPIPGEGTVEGSDANINP